MGFFNLAVLSSNSSIEGFIKPMKNAVASPGPTCMYIVCRIREKLKVKEGFAMKCPLQAAG